MIEATIQQAKQRLRESIRLYLQKDEAGQYVLPQNKQRPIYLEGPAGLGKTEVVRQAAQEAGIGFVSYSMTHHSRQSAIGLPAIVEKEFGGETYKATEYTMSEIVEAVWNERRKGFAEGILFADEVNCISETLTAAMLQFLQNKTFGPHRIPEGWIIVAAGNPPEYNKSVRAFDAVTRDRLRAIRVRPDLKAWVDYAVQKGMHPVVIQYVREHSAEFYCFSVEKGQQQIVTPRGWEDLSNTLRLYEENGFSVDEALITEFLQCEKTALGFLNYYRTVRSLLTQEEIQAILSGKTEDQLAAKLRNYSFQERWAALTVLLGALEWEIGSVLEKVTAHDKRYRELKSGKPTTGERSAFDEQTAALDAALDRVRDRIGIFLSFVNESFGAGREAEIAIQMLLENEQVQKLAAYRRLDALIRLYEELQLRRGEAMEEIRAWSERQGT